MALASSASFSSTVFNGGKVMSCTEGQDTKLSLFDFNEAERERGWVVDFGSGATTIEAKLEVAFERIARLDTEQSKLYRGLYQDFLKSRIFVNDADLPVTTDADSVIIPPNCRLLQAAV